MDRLAHAETHSTEALLYVPRLRKGQIAAISIPFEVDRLQGVRADRAPHSSRRFFEPNSGRRSGVKFAVLGRFIWRLDVCYRVPHLLEKRCRQFNGTQHIRIEVDHTPTASRDTNPQAACGLREFLHVRSVRLDDNEWIAGMRTRKDVQGDRHVAHSPT
ncbi:hypothetical protein D3227_40335 [Mesorhizobium waimense]|uniref:Uncharacterized protein n=1 Tax=Mesorhizobium waimense TaxID=1300307 RepID=A0A3A5JS27_9HYPH|nr:hypothetical protein D3227_40335 [Mesorhizobium waimense]